MGCCEQPDCTDAVGRLGLRHGLRAEALHQHLASITRARDAHVRGAGRAADLVHLGLIVLDAGPFDVLVVFLDRERRVLAISALSAAGDRKSVV